MSSSENSSFDEEELSEFRVDPVDQESFHDASIDTEAPKKRGRPKLKEHWTRVILIDGLTKPDSKIFELAQDLIFAKADPSLSRGLQLRHWIPIFTIKGFF
jgi:hypothetical protein